MTSRLPTQCLSCRWWESPLTEGPDPVQRCNAFPLEGGGIPDEIWMNHFDHRNPHPGDHGILWETNGEAFPAWAMQQP